MDYKTEKVTIANLVDQFKSGALSRDEEYQRGVEWSLTQQQGLIDSIFRRYPIPPIFLHEKRVKSLRGEESTTYDIVDGQQRLVALRDFRANNFCLLDRSDKKLRIPHSLRQKPAPWGKRWYRDLDNLQAEFDNRTLDVFFIEGAVERDEIRDLFIRLQSGTALTRQQVRDAWPGNVGPFVVALAGKFSSRPKFTGKSSGRSLFQLIDRRGQGVDEDTDQYDFDRQFCAQLLTLFVARERDILSEQGTSANNLDQLYHEETTDFAPGSKTAKGFEKILSMTTNIFDTALAEKPEKTKGTKRKFRKIDAISVFLLVQDVLRGDHLVSEDRFASRVAEHVRSHSNVPLSGKTTSGHVIREYYERWRTSIGGDIGVRLDPKRAFDSKQKKEIYERDQAKCRVCNKALTRGDGDEYDHFPAPHALGGRTVVENGRLVCREHNPRGPLGEDDLAEPATMKARPKPRSIRVRG